MRFLLGLLVLLLLPTSAQAGPIEDMDAVLNKLRVLEFPSETSEAKATILEMTQLIQSLDALTSAASEVDSGQAGLRVGEGFLLAGEALFAAPCPESLDEATCAVYTAAMADHAEPFLQRAVAILKKVSESPIIDSEKDRLTQLADRAQTVLLRAQSIEMPPAPPPPARAPGRSIPWTDPPESAGWGLVWKDAWFEGAGQTVRGSVQPRGPSKNPVWLVRIVGDDPDSDGRVLVQTGHEVVPEHHCHTAAPLHSAWRITFSVAAADIVPVLTELSEIENRRGTQAVLEAGLPVLKEGVLLGNLTLPVPAKELSVGRSYRPHAVSTETFGAKGRFPADAVLKLGNRGVGLHPGPYSPEVVADRWDPKRKLATFEERCGFAVLRAESAVIRPEDGAMSGLFGKKGGGTHPTFVEAGATLYSPDGSAVGSVGRRVIFQPMEQADGDRSCGSLPFGGSGHPESTLKVCVDRSQLQ